MKAYHTNEYNRSFGKYFILTIAVIVMAGLMLTACEEKEAADSGENIEQTAERRIPEKEQTEDEEKVYENVFGTFTSQTLDGTEVTQEIFAEADLTLVNIWGTFCAPCIREMPELGEISREYEREGVQVVGILCDVFAPGDESALGIVESTKADYTHIVLSQDLQSGFLGQVQAVPTTLLVDSSGNQVGEICTGSRSKSDFVKMIEEALREVR